jgi:HAD superfamily hydrolase (TIGR01549 family)
MLRPSAVLFDLDGTLLESNMQAFLPAYLQMAGARAAHLMPPKQFIAHLLAATEEMVRNDGRATNKTVFESAFYPATGLGAETWDPIFAGFYRDDFPTLEGITRRKPEARGVVELAFAAGMAVVIATNPLFPEVAVRQRMAWAGVEGLPYSLVTTYENSRYAKPNLRYFDAIAAILGLPPERCLVVGDEDYDMVAARAGFPTFLVPSEASNLDPDTPPPTYTGDLAALARLLEP